MRLRRIRRPLLLPYRTAAEAGRLRRRPTQPTPDELKRQAVRCRGLLMRSVLDFYLPAAVDAEHGGYHELADAGGSFLPSATRLLSLQARQLWLFSTLAAEGVRRDETLAAAQAGYEYLGRFRDELNGGYHSTISVEGDPIERRKEICLLGYALYALAAYHRATGDGRPLDEARQLFAELEAHAYDRRYGGYLELFETDWSPIQDNRVRAYWAWGGAKTVNGQMHLLETLAELHRVWPDPLVTRRLGELVSINQWAVKHPRFNCNVTLWSLDWRMLPNHRNARSSYGHDLEGVWLTVDAARTLGWPGHVLRGWAEAMCRYSLEHGFDPRYGGFYAEGPLGRPADDRSKEWWVQAEALVAMLELFRLTSDPGYYSVFASTLDFIEAHQVAPGGGWWSVRREDGSWDPRGLLGSVFQDGYHSGRALLRSEQLLALLASG